MRLRNMSAVQTGIQEKFSWNAVAMTAISAGVVQSGAGEWVAGQFGANAETQKFLYNAIAGTADEVISQSIGRALGPQTKFDWAGVAAAGLTEGVIGKWAPRGTGGTRGKAIRGTARLLINATTRTLINGTDFGDNMLGALSSVIGTTIGEAFSELTSPDEEVADPNAEHAPPEDVAFPAHPFGMMVGVVLPFAQAGARHAPRRLTAWDRFWSGVGDWLGFDNGGFDFRNIGPRRTDSAPTASHTGADTEIIYVNGDLYGPPRLIWPTPDKNAVQTWYGGPVASSHWMNTIQALGSQPRTSRPQCNACRPTRKFARERTDTA